MRKEAKTSRTTTIANVQGYHQGGYNGNYAYQGFRANKYFTSDRFIALDANFNRPDGKPLKGYGLEIETTCRGIHNETVYAEVLDKIIFSAFPSDLFKMQRDGSLGGDTSAECITQVMSREFVRNQYSAFKLMYDHYFPAFGVACDSSCGMHCNISLACFGAKPETQAEAVRKLYYIVNKHYDLMCEMVNRDHHRTGYCQRMNYTKTYAQTLDLENQMCSHGVCFNLGHYDEGRIELRLVGGQKNYACFRNTMETVFFLVDAVKRLSWADLDDITKIFKGCNQYVADRLSRARTAGYCTTAQLDAVMATVKREELL